MADAPAKGHDYHLVDPSPWPIIGAVGAFVLAVGVIMWLHEMASPVIALIGLAIVLYTMYGWWRDIVIEAEFKGDHTPVVQIHLRYGMFLFIASEVMFFVAWFWAYFDASLFPGDAPMVARAGVPQLDEVAEITLSYTFFPIKEDEAEQVTMVTGAAPQSGAIASMKERRE